MSPYTTPAQQARKAFFKRLRWYSLIGGTLLLAIFAAVIVIRLPIFKVATIEVVGVPSDAQAGILRDVKLSLLQINRFAILGGDNYFSWPNEYPYAASAATSLTMEKSFWDKKITLTAVPRGRYAVWCTDETIDERCAWIDQLGVAFADAPVAEGQLVRTIYSKGTAQISAEGRPVVDADTFSVIKKIIDGIATLPIDIVKTTYDNVIQELQLQTDYGTLIRFSARIDPTTTVLPALRKFIEKPGLEKLEYLNLTVENRAFLKYR